ncbi:MAG: response regulator [Bacteroidetes bacterium]|nr:MAG: response regulator [Bacteroidota bacterium]
MDDEKTTVLIVDDDVTYVSLVKYLLDSYNTRQFEVLSESSGDAALRTLKTVPTIKIVLMDYYLGEETGLEIIQKINDEHIDVPIVFLTSNKDYRAAVDAMKFGVVDYILKDTTMDIALPKTILKILDNVKIKKQREELEKQNFLSEKKTEAIRELVVTMCHEFNNPLAAIKISAAIIQRQKIDDEQRSLIQRLNTNIIYLENQLKVLRDINIEEH